MPDLSQSSWSETDASNNSASPSGFPEGMAPSGVNDSARAVMGALKRFWNRINGLEIATGTGDAIVLTYDVAPAALSDGETYSFEASAANTTAATLNINALGAKSIKKITTSGYADLAANDFLAAQRVVVQYDATTATFRLLTQTANPPTITAATTTASGIVELATSAEAVAGTDATRAVVPSGLLATRSLVVDVNTQADSYTLVLADAGKVVEMNKATAQTLTVPPNSSVAFPTNTQIELVQLGAGQVTIAAGAGVTITSSDGKLKLFGRYSGATIYKRATDWWVLIGDLVS